MKKLMFIEFITNNLTDEEFNRNYGVSKNDVVNGAWNNKLQNDYRMF